VRGSGKNNASRVVRGLKAENSEVMHCMAGAAVASNTKLFDLLLAVLNRLPRARSLANAACRFGGIKSLLLNSSALRGI
jgi:hypothetical protein